LWVHAILSSPVTVFDHAGIVAKTASKGSSNDQTFPARPFIIAAVGRLQPLLPGLQGTGQKSVALDLSVAQIVAAWPKLAEPIRRAMTALVG